MTFIDKISEHIISYQRRDLKHLPKDRDQRVQIKRNTLSLSPAEIYGNLIYLVGDWMFINLQLDFPTHIYIYCEWFYAVYFQPFLGRI